MLRHDRLGRGMQTSRPAIEPESLPHREHVIDGSCREVLDGWESREESFVIGCAACNPRPLEEIFGDEDPIGVSRPPPGEIAPVRVVPGEQSAPDLGRRELAHRAHDAQAPTSEIRGAVVEIARGHLVSTSNKVNRNPAALGRPHGLSKSLENLARLAAPKEKVERRHRDPDVVGETFHP